MIVLTIIVFVIILGILIFAHELGHFLAAKSLGVRVEEFGFGFPPRLVRVFKRGDTEYTFNWIPVGGFVKMTGQSDFEVEDQEKIKDDPKSFLNKKPWQRLIILCAGVGMNFALAAILLSIGFMIGLPAAVGPDMPAGAQVKDERIQVLLTDSGSPADEAGITSGDTILALNGSVPETVQGVVDYNTEHKGQTITITIERGDEILDKEVALRADPPKGEGPLGISLAETAKVSFPWYLAIWQGIKSTGELTVEIIVAFGRLIGSLISAGQVSGEVAGPVGIAVLTGQVTKLGFVYILQFTALLSINLAIINILPFPALDGGHILFLLVEKIRGGKTHQAAKVENIIHLIGFGLIFALLAAVTYRDVAKSWDKITGFFT
ncbi:RIP metalloprotease [Patescibacteria group bacterium]